jgi:uncharacterized protein YkwD
MHGNAETAIGMVLPHRFWQPLGFAAEYHDVAGIDLGFGEMPPRRLRQEPVCSVRQARNQAWPIVNDFPIEVVPIVQPGPANVAVVNKEAQGADEPQFRTGGYASAADIAGIEGNFRLVKDNVEDGFRHNRRLCRVANLHIVTRLGRFDQPYAEDRNPARRSVMHCPLGYRLATLAAFLLALLQAGGGALAAGDQKTPMSVAPENRSEVNRLLQKYRAAGSDLEKKEEICRKALTVDPAAARLMLAAVERDLQPQFRKYCSKFQVHATAAAKRKTGKLDLKEVMEIRFAIRGMEASGDRFTKQLIVEKIDPLVQHLRAAFLLDRKDILGSSADLQAERKKLETLGGIRDQCRACLTSEKADDGPPNSGPTSYESYLQAEEELAALLALPQDPKARAVLAVNTKLAGKLDPEEAETIRALNITRTLLGLPVLAIDLRLCEAARDHSKDMARLKFFSHESPVPGKTTPADRARLAGSTAGAENISTGTPDGKSANDGWFHSPGHHRNQVGNHARVGVGRSGTYYTQMFGS